MARGRRKALALRLGKSDSMVTHLRKFLIFRCDIIVVLLVTSVVLTK